ncbi:MULTISPECIES: Y-family DNA polymerase [Bacillus]|uniref:Y-family DNA polymerase n=1 Tax=Bacillus TaxID=1386 RepID=UPI0008FE9CB6|nr:MULTISPECIES: hypothetical protein [Bacillus]AXO93215.1 hypothetical protein DY471_12715 [Bacillus anthracis]MDD0817505.1 hypothetical protein [Bacillus cereus]OJD88120.1 hypothetical protein MCCC1A01412_18385 [Bacillus anthracis]OWW10207.1 DNA damage repair protein [Bacillus sp. MB353a]HDR4511117.1 hypothetical protein [Bacillus cereus]
MYDYSILPNRIILCVDLRSFYASVSCIKMGLDPLHTKLAVVGDVNRNGSIVLAATPPLKAMGVKKLARLYEIPREKDILIVNPIMGTYIKCSNYITKLALQYVPIEDFHQYSIDEFFMDITDSIHLFARNSNEFALQFKREIYEHTRIECTIGIAPNLLMSKVVLDIEAKKNKDGVAYWTYEDIPTKLWSIRPLSKFWRISHKTETKLNQKGVHSIGEGEEQISLFDNIIQREKEIKLMKVMDEIRTKFGKNSILRGISYTNNATARYRNTLLGGHKA